MRRKTDFQNRTGEDGERRPRTKTPEEALTALMNLCAKSEKSSGDAMRLMSRWGVEQTQRSGVLARLIEARFIDDNRYAEAYVREKESITSWGEYKIRTALAAKGINRATIDHAMQQFGRGESTDRKLSALLQRKLPSIKASSDFERRTKLIRYALAQGYDYQSILDAIDLIATSQEEVE